MKASELIAVLTSMIAEFGDLEVRTGSGLQNAEPAPWYGDNETALRCVDPQRHFPDGHGFFLD